MEENNRARCWCFTLNNYSEEEFWNIIGDIGNYTYIVVGFEVGDEGTPHLQGYIEFPEAKRFQTLQKFNDRIHWAKRFATASQASDYCKEDGLFFELGTISHQGKRNDILEAIKMIDDGFKWEDIAKENPVTYVKFNRGLNAYKNAISKHRTGPPEVHWRWGKSGVGKTRYCVEKHPDHYMKDDTKWWDGYEWNEAIIIDDFDGEWPYRTLLKLFDRYKFSGQNKFGYIKINSPFIYITSEYPPSHYWQDNKLTQITRRLASVTEVAGNTNGN